ncbi:MAG: hypothetical protein CR961_01245 [Polaribacter sp.]|nr:MAG: hypothetical protein CR961_01245 [Polaribacter sp.]
MSVARVFEVSSNVGVVKVIQKYYHNNPKKYTDRLAFFGIGKKTGVSIKGEGKPRIPNPKNKSLWSKITLEWMAWGYGVTLTPLQTLTFYNAVANNGELVKPRFVREIRSGNKVEKRFEKVVLNPKIARQTTIDKAKQMMVNVVKRGTADNIYSPNFSMAGKTGTAQKYIPRHKGDDGKMVAGHYSTKHYVASFVGFFPVENPKYSCIVVIHDPDKKKGYYGATVAGPVFKEIAHKIYTSTPASIEAVYDTVKFAKVDEDYQKYYENLQKYKTVMPNVLGMTAMDAVSLLENMGLKVEFKGLGKVKEQSIKQGKKISKGAKIYLKLS